MSSLGPAYLIHGDDHGSIAERQVRLRHVVGAQVPATTVETLEGAQATPAALAETLGALRLSMGWRVIVVDGVERWKDAEVRQHVVPAMAEMPLATTVALFAREDTRTKAPPSLHEAVKQAGGQVALEKTLERSELPRWVRAEGARLGLALDDDAAKLLVAHVGERRQRLLRELEKLALEAGARDAAPEAVRLSAEQLEPRVARSSELEAYTLADALVEPAPERSLRAYLRLREQGERLPGLLYLIASRLRQALLVATRLQQGEPPSAVRRDLRMPSRAADRLIADAKNAGVGRLRDALGVIADLELESRGGPIVRADARVSALSEDTLALRAILAIGGPAGARGAREGVASEAPAGPAEAAGSRR